MKSLILIIPFIYVCCASPDRKSAPYPDCTSQDIEKMDTCLLGMSLGAAIEKLKVDTSQFYTIDEPPLIIRGIRVQLADTCTIELYVDRTSIIDKVDSVQFHEQHLQVINKKIIGVFWEKEKENKHREISVPDEPSQ